MVARRAASVAISPDLSPWEHFSRGIAFGLPSGICEEIGWMGSRFLGTLASAVIDIRGASVPRGSEWLRFFFAFTIVMTAMQVIIAWLYLNTGSVLLTQLMHVSSTGALVVLSPGVRRGEEVMGYFGGCLLWLFLTIIVSPTGWHLQRSERQNLPGEQRLKTPELNRIVPMMYKPPCFQGEEAKAEADVTGDRQWRISRQRRTYKILF